MLPSYLILFVDIVSFALPLQGGGRNAFKVTLVLSFTLFINILNSQLPGDSECSPIIRESCYKEKHVHKQTVYMASHWVLNKKPD